MSHNHEYHMWKAHTDHSVTVKEWISYDMSPTVILGCDTCNEIIEVWEFIPEYEPLDNTAQSVLDFGD